MMTSDLNHQAEGGTIYGDGNGRGDVTQTLQETIPFISLNYNIQFDLR